MRGSVVPGSGVSRAEPALSEVEGSDRPTVLVALGTISGPTSTTWGFGINNSGVVIGQSTFTNTYHAFVYSSGRMKDLNKLIPPGSGWVLVEADGVNDSGQIVGMGMHNGQEHAFLLTPQ